MAELCQMCDGGCANVRPRRRTAASSCPWKPPRAAVSALDAQSACRTCEARDSAPVRAGQRRRGVSDPFQRGRCRRCDPRRKSGRALPPN